MGEISNDAKILELLLEVLNLLHAHDGHMGDQNYKEISKKITDLYKYVK